MRAIRRPWGMVLLTGPTGSGKSTTLHTAIKAIKSPRKNIVTVEDPVEYRQPGIQQVQVKTEIGFDFARSLRSILRQDPDIIMVGEIRDAETAQIAVRAALTGHLVLSTLAHQRRHLDPGAADQHRGGAVPGGDGGERGGGPAAGQEDLQALQGSVPAESGGGRALRARSRRRRCSTGDAAAGSAGTSATPDAWRCTRSSGSTPRCAG